MPSKAPRIQVTLDPEAQKAVSELAELTSRSRSAVVGELVDMALPALLTMLDAIRLAKRQPLEAQRLLNRYANQATAELSQAQLEFDQSIDRRTVRGKRRPPDAKT